MPRLLAFLPAEKVLIDGEDNSLAIVGLIAGVNIAIPLTPDLPPDAAVPMRWYVVSVWRREPEDEGRIYHQRLRMVGPSRRILIDTLSEFQLTGDSHRVRVLLQGFPISEQGEHILQLSLSYDQGQ